MTMSDQPYQKHARGASPSPGCHPAGLSPSDAARLLQFLADEANIDLSDAETQMKRKEKAAALKACHPYKIYKSGGRWQTHIKDPSQPNNRRKVVRKEKCDLIDFLFDHYGLVLEDAAQSRKTLEDIYPDWLKYKSLHTAETYIPRIESDWKKFYENTAITSVPIITLTKLQLDEWVHELIRKYALTKTSYYNMSMIMRQCLDYAVELGITEENVFRKVRVDGRRVLRRTPKKASETQVFSDEELKQFYAFAMEDYRTGAAQYELSPLAAIFQFQTGLRISEVCAVRYGDVEGEKLHVQRMLQRDTGKVLDRTKGDFEDRYVFLTPESRKVITLARKRQWERGVSSEGYIFSLTEEPCSYRAVSARFRHYSEKMGLTGKNVKSSHKARKTFISAALDAGVNLDTVRRSAGHKDEQTTLGNYLYDRSGEEEQARKFELAVDRIHVG